MVVAVLLFVLLCGAYGSPLEKLKAAQESISKLEVFITKYKEMTNKMQDKDISVTCALCGIVVNEIAGFIIENLTVAEMETILKNDICANLGFAAPVCDLLVDSLPLILNGLENQWSVSVVCVDLSLCTAPFQPHVDPFPIPKYTINLDLPPVQRWNHICSDPTLKLNAQYLYNTFYTLTGSALGDIGQEINDNYFPQELAQEIIGCAQQLGIPYGFLALFNLGYEVSDACTAIIAQTKDGKILHGRNMDFWAGMGFTDTLKNMAIMIDYQKGGKTVFSNVAFAGYVGVLSGFKAGAYSVTVNTRFYPGGIGQLFYEVIAAIEEKNASLVTFLVRKVMQNENDFQSALENLSTGELIADVYYTLAGASAGQGAVISRNRTAPDDVWMLAPPARWYEVETNYDHWQPPPWFDDRLDPANDAMNALGQDNLSLPNILQVLSVKPVLNIQTTYTILACPATGEFTAYTRWCTYPCVE